jgi:hypothetical protein
MSTPTRKRFLSGPSGSVKKKKYNCKFQADWMKDFQFVRPSSLGTNGRFPEFRHLSERLPHKTGRLGGMMNRIQWGLSNNAILWLIQHTGLSIFMRISLDFSLLSIEVNKQWAII